jgi:hypothetical protein
MTCIIIPEMFLGIKNDHMNILFLALSVDWKRRTVGSGHRHSDCEASEMGRGLAQGFCPYRWR